MSTNTISKKTVTYEFFTISLREDGIIHIHGEAYKTIDMRTYRGLIAVLGEMTGGKKVPMLNTAGELTMPDDEVKAYMAQPDANPYSCATAFVMSSFTKKLVFNFFTAIKKPARPVKLFTDEQEAVMWLKSFIENPHPLA
jgi:hypothetical protein